MGFRDRGVEIKTPEQIAKMRRAGLLVGETLELLREAVRPGVTTGELDGLAEANIRNGGGIPSFLGYSHPPFPASICASVNDEVVHGIPGSRVLQEGDVISIDCGAIVGGWHGDAAITVLVGDVAPDAVALSQACEASMWDGLAAARVNGRLTDISHAVETSVRKAGKYGIVTGYGGHGIGSEMHMAPHILNYGRPGKGPRLTPGMALAIEPMITAGGRSTQELDDGWTVSTVDGSWAAHWEHTVAILDDGPWVLTAEDGGRAELGKRGVDLSARAA